MKQRIHIKPINQHNEDKALPELNINNLINISIKDDFALSENDIKDLKNVIETNSYCIKLSNYIKQINLHDAKKNCGVGLAADEKMYFNEINEIMSNNFPKKTDSLEVIGSKIKLLAEKKIFKAKMSNIILLNEKYLSILSDKNTWRKELIGIQKDWYKHKRFASSDSEELLILYNIYQDAEKNIQDCVYYFKYYKKTISSNNYNILMKYLHEILQEIAKIKNEACNSMLFRLNLAFKSVEIHDDDVIKNFIERIEAVLKSRIIVEDKDKQYVYNELRERRRRGLTFHALKEFYAILKELPQNIEKEEALESIIKENEAQKLFINNTDKNPVIYMLVDKFEVFYDKIVCSLLLETDHALIMLKDLYFLIQECRIIFSQLIDKTNKYNDSSLKQALERYNQTFSVLVIRVKEHLENELITCSCKLTEKIDIYNKKEMENYQTLKKKYLSFLNEYEEFIDKKENGLKYDLTFQLLKNFYTAIIENTGLQKNNEMIERIAQIIAEDYYWPIRRENINEYEVTKEALVINLKLLFDNIKYNYSIESEYLLFNWMLNFLELVFPSPDRFLDKYYELAALYNGEWIDTLPISNYDQAVKNLPLCMKTDFTNAGDKAKLIFSNFFFGHVDLFLKYKEYANHFLNVTIPYIENCPLIDLFSFEKPSILFNTINNFEALINTINEKTSSLNETDLKNHELNRQFIQFINDESEKLIAKSNQALLKAIYINTKLEDITDYLLDSNNLINIKKIQLLLNKINKNFDDHYYKEKLITKIGESCLNILITQSEFALNKMEKIKVFQQYMSNLTFISLIKPIGNFVFDKLLCDNNILRLIQDKITKFDGSKSEIGSLLFVITPKELNPESEINKQILDYSLKRLSYIANEHENEITLNDILFFKKTMHIEAIRDVFLKYKDNYFERIIIPLFKKSDLSWDYKYFKIIELFGDDEIRSYYREKCIEKLLKKDVVDEDDLSIANEIINYSRFDIEDPIITQNQTPLSQQNNLSKLINNVSINLPWNPVRDLIISNFNKESAPSYHLHFIFEYLNNHASHFGEWLFKQRTDIDPIDFFGSEGLIMLSKHILGLIKISKRSANKMNLNANEIDNELELLQRLENLSVIFGKLENPSSNQIIDNIQSLKKLFMLAKLINKVLNLFQDDFPNDSYSVMSINKLFDQVLTLFSKIEDNQLVGFDNIEGYLTSILNMLKNIDNMVPKLNNLYTAANLYDFKLKLRQHMNNVLIYIAKESYLPDEDKKLFISVINWLDDNEKIKDRERDVLSLLDETSEFFHFIKNILDFAKTINLSTLNTKNHFKLVFKNFIHDNNIADNNSHLAYAYFALIVEGIRNSDSSVALLNYLFKKLEKSFDKIPIMAIKPFCQDNQFIKNSIFCKMRLPTNSNMLSFDEKIKTKNLCADIFLIIFHYFSNKITFKSSNTNQAESLLKLASQYVNTQNNNLEYLKKIFHLNNEHRLRKIGLLLNIINKISNIFSGSEHMNIMESFIGRLIIEVNTHKKEYKPNKFSELLLLIKDMVTNSANINAKHLYIN